MGPDEEVVCLQKIAQLRKLVNAPIAETEGRHRKSK